MSANKQDDEPIDLDELRSVLAALEILRSDIECIPSAQSTCCAQFGKGAKPDSQDDE